MTFRRMLLAMAIFVHGFAALAQTRVPVPSVEAQQKALGLLRELYKKEYDAAQTSAQKEELAQKLLQMAQEIKTSADQYAVLRVARDLSLAAGGPVCFLAVDEIAKTYQVDGLDMKAKVLAGCSAAAKTRAQKKAVAEAGIALVNRALAEDRPDVAKSTCEALLAAARKARDADLVKQVAALKMNVAEVAKAAEEAESAMAVLKTSPNDPAANLVVGKYRCLSKGDWEKGLPMLALGSDPGLRAAATKELGRPATPNDQATVGDGWWALAEQEKIATKEKLQAHAARWYEQALPDLAGLTKTRIRKRLESLAPAESKKPAVVDLLKSVDPKTQTAAGEWVVKDGELHGISDKRFSRGASIVLPCDAVGDYQLHVEFTRTKGSNRIAALLPVESTQCMLALSGNHDNSGVELIEGEQFTTNASRVPDHIVNDQRYRLDIRVRKQGENVLIEAALDGKPHLSWTGPASQLSPSICCKLPQPSMLGVGVGPPGPTHVTFHAIKFTKLTGEPTPRPKTPAKPKRMDLKTLLTSTKWIRRGQHGEHGQTEFLFVFNPNGTCTGSRHGRTTRSSGHTKWALQGNTLLFASAKGTAIQRLQFDARRKGFIGVTEGWRYIMYPTGN